MRGCWQLHVGSHDQHTALSSFNMDTPSSIIVCQLVEYQYGSILLQVHVRYCGVMLPLVYERDF